MTATDPVPSCYVDPVFHALDPLHFAEPFGLVYALPPLDRLSADALLDGPNHVTVIRTTGALLPFATYAQLCGTMVAAGGAVIVTFPTMAAALSATRPKAGGA